MAEKAVIIGLFASLLGTAGVLWAKMPPRPEIYSTHVKQIAKEPRAEVRVIPIPPPAKKEVMPSGLPDNTQHSLVETTEPKEVMPDIAFNTSPDIQPRQVRIPKPRPVGAVRKPHCPCKKKHRRPVFVLPQANGGLL